MIFVCFGFRFFIQFQFHGGKKITDVTDESQKHTKVLSKQMNLRKKNLLDMKRKFESNGENEVRKVCGSEWEDACECVFKDGDVRMEGVRIYASSY